MHRIALVHSAPTDPEIAVVQISKEDHDKLITDATKFFQSNSVFSKPVKEAKVQHPSEPATMVAEGASAVGSTCMLVLVHMPACNVIGYCIPL